MNRAVLTAVVIVLVAAAGWWVFRRGSADRVDLLTQFDSAVKAGGTYTVVDATLAGETKKAILAPPNGRLTFKVRVPEDGWLKVSLGMQPESWEKEGNGVYFFAGVSDTRAFEKLFEQTLNPFSRRELSLLVLSIDLVRTTTETKLCLKSLKILGELA